MLSELCHELKNWFEQSKLIGQFEVKDGVVTIYNDGTPVPFAEGQYFRIVGSIFNDGVWKYGDDNDLVNEVFDGAVWFLAIPKEVVNLSNDIDDWKAKYMTLDSPAMSPFTSESFGGYSYSKSTGDANSGNTSWQNNFKSQLNKWRKI